MRILVAIAAGLLILALPAERGRALERPWISDVYFYWYQWDYQRRTGNWLSGVYNTPLVGYYDSSRLEDNLRELHMAAEWGITHHFMDFWGHAWLDEKGRPRERCLMDAAEEMRRRGYDCWMSYYQDGQDFQMDDFARNLDPGRAVEGWVRNYASSPAWPKINGKPVQLVYGRNGRPKITATDEGFRQWLRARYRTLHRLRAAWKQNIRTWADCRWDPSAGGVQRADSILYQYDLWQRSWDEVNRIVKAKYGFPGIIASFDIAYQPFNGWGFSLQAKTFAGPHSYGGIFGQPHEQDAERFIQAAVAKWYGTVFFDTFKNFYYDWEIRYPGTCYPPEPHHFDRFWTIALAHYAEALLHLSWNEWWEGSNLEPCWEYGKTYCEKNLLYATVMKACFDSIRRAQTSGEVAVLLNDWHWLASGLHTHDIYDTIQALRSACVDFKLLPDDFVTPNNLRGVQLVIAPTGLTGLGYNASGQPIADVLSDWLRADDSHRLVIGALPSSEELPAECGQTLRDFFGLRRAPLPSAGAPTTMNAFIDVGEEGDDQFLISGRSNREDWSKLPDTAYGKRRQRHTIRWCPGSGHQTRILLPLAPGRQQLLTICGDAIWPNSVAAAIDGRQLGRFAVKPGYQRYELTIPAQAATSPLALLTLTFETARIPDVETKGKNRDRRVCNLAIDWIHVRTPDQPADRRVPAKPPAGQVTFAGLLKGLEPSELPLRRWEPVTAPDVQILSRYEPSGLVRDMLLYDGRVWYCHGCLGDCSDPEYWRRILGWAKVQPRWLAQGEGVIGACLSAGETTILLAYNTDITRQATVRLQPPKHDWPLAEARAVSRDGIHFPPNASITKGADTFRYHGLYQFAFCPVRPDFDGGSVPETPSLWPSVLPGMTGELPVRLANLTDRPVRGRLTLDSFLPSLTAKPVAFSLKARQTKVVALPIVARDDLDWGRKTVCLVVDIDGRRAYFWRRLYVATKPQFRASATWQGDNLVIHISLVPRMRSWDVFPAAGPATVTFNGKVIGRGHLATPHKPVAHSIIPRDQVGDRRQLTVGLSYSLLGSTHTHLITVPVPPREAEAVAGPPDARSAVIVPAGKLPGPRVVRAPGTLGKGYWEVRDASGRRGLVGAWTRAASASAENKQQGLWLIAPSGASGPLFICRRDSPPPTDLRLTTLPDGRVQVRNSELLAVFDSTRGGTVTELRWRGGRNIAANSFGASWGRWGRFDPLHPRTTADRFLTQERKACQWQAGAQVTVTQQSPAHVTVHVEQHRMLFTIRQDFTFFAYMPFFVVESSVTAGKTLDLEKLGIDEIVPLDIPLDRGPWTKIYPNFTGRSFGDKPRFHDGWRESPRVPPVATIMDHRTYRASLSLFYDDPRPPSSALPPMRFRQGFFPARRGTRGTPDAARLEIIRRYAPLLDAPWIRFSSDNRLLEQHRGPSARAIILLHDGSQATAEDIAAAGLIASAERSASVRPTGQARRPAAEDWWSDAYDVRAPVSQRLTDEGLAVDWPARVGDRWVDPAAICAVWHGSDGPQVLQSVVTMAPSATARVAIEPPHIDLGTGRLYLYSRLTDTPPSRPEELKAGLPDPSFERGGDGWRLERAVLDTSIAHTGRVSIKLHAPARAGAYSLLRTHLADVRPNTRYSLKLWAMTRTPGATLIANFYVDANYDFHHVSIPLKADGQWHEYQADVPTGAFPATVRPSLRLWVYHHPGPVWVDDVELKQTGTERRRTLVGPAELLLPKASD